MGKEENQKITILKITGLLDLSLKALPLIGGFYYVIGLIFISVKLFLYGSPLTTLFDFQYFAAGLPFGTMILVTAINVVLTQYTKIDIYSSKQKRSILASAIIVSLILAVYVKSYPLSELAPIGFLVLFVVLQIQIWLAMTATKFTTSWTRFFKFFDYLWVLYIAIIFLIISVTTYNQLPQTFGGGKLQTVRFIVDPARIPSELIDREIQSEDADSAITIPLNLVFKSNREYLVFPVGVEQYSEIWILKDEMIYAIKVKGE